MSGDPESSPALSVVVPVYKEESSIEPFLARLVPVVERIGTYEVVFCLAPSPDRTEEVIRKAMEANPNVKLMVFSRRFGQPAATMAGILTCRGAACAVIDVDLQDPPELIGELHARLKEGYEVVCAKRRSRRGETLIKRTISSLGYRVISMMSDVEIPRDTGDFRIMSRRVVEELRRLNEPHGFLRGLVAYVGFRQTFVLYDRDERAHGKGNYNRLLGSLTIGLNGLISFSRRPLMIMSFMGAFFAVSSILVGLWYLI